VFYAFDLLCLDRKHLLHEPLIERKKRLESCLKPGSGLVRYSGSLGEDAAVLRPQVRKLGLEGLIGKRKDSVYEPGRRSGAWIKLKLHQHRVGFNVLTLANSTIGPQTGPVLGPASTGSIKSG